MASRKAYDTKVFLLSLLLATALWFIYNLSLSYSGIINVPVVASSNIEGHSSLSSGSTMISARCRTTGWRLIASASRSGRKPRVVNLPPEEFIYQGDDNFTVSAQALAGHIGDIFGEQVRLESFLSPSFKFRFMSENCRKVPVVPVGLITYRKQYTSVGGIKTVPDSVVIYGDNSFIGSIDHMNTRNITRTDLASSVHGVVKLDVPDGLRVSQQEVSYTLDVTRFIEMRKTVQIHADNVPQDRSLAIYPSTAEVVFRCIFPMSGISVDNVRFFVDYNDFALSSDGRCLPHTSQLPGSVIDYTVDPQLFDCIENVR